MADLEQPVESVTVRLEEGSRCVCEGCYGTVRYVGEVPPSKGEQHTLATVWAWDGYCQIWWAANGYVVPICCTSSPHLYPSAALFYHWTLTGNRIQTTPSLPCPPPCMIVSRARLTWGGKSPCESLACEK